MRFSALFRIALRSLSRNKLRSFLTMLGIVIGVAAVIAMLAVGQGARASVEKSIASLGSNVLIISPGAFNQSGIRLEAGSGTRFTEDDAEAIRRESDAILYITPLARAGVQLKAGGQNWRTNIYGVYPEYLLIRQWNVASGVAFASSDEKSAAKVCLIGRTIADFVAPASEDIFRRALGPEGREPARIEFVTADGQIRIAELLTRAIRLILLTVPGERHMRPEFGCRIHNYVFAPNNDETRSFIGYEVREALGRWEPRIEVDTVDLRPLPGVVLKHFAACDIVSRWDVLAVFTRACTLPGPCVNETNSHPYRTSTQGMDSATDLSSGSSVYCDMS